MRRFKILKNLRKKMNFRWKKSFKHGNKIGKEKLLETQLNLFLIYLNVLIEKLINIFNKW